MSASRRIEKYLAEGFGTFAMIFAGTGSIVVNEISGGTVTSVGISLTFGLVVLSMIYSIGHISGAHMNPAVSLAFYFSGRMDRGETSRYILAQTVGALAASLFLRTIFFNQQTSLGVTLPAGSAVRSFLLEFVLTLILMFVIRGVATDNRAQGVMAGVAIGSTIAFEALMAGPISGASMNPARSLAPALVSGHLSNLWIYLLAPVLGSLAGSWIYNRVSKRTEVLSQPPS